MRTKCENLKLYSNHIQHSYKLFEALSELEGKFLVCWCHEKLAKTKCHGSVLIRLFNQYNMGHSAIDKGEKEKEEEEIKEIDKEIDKEIETDLKKCPSSTPKIKVEIFENEEVNNKSLGELSSTSCSTIMGTPHYKCHFCKDFLTDEIWRIHKSLRLCSTDLEYGMFQNYGFIVSIFLEENFYIIWIINYLYIYIYFSYRQT